MTIDPTTITTPFGLLDDETQAQLEAAFYTGMKIESVGFDSEWSINRHPAFEGPFTYRLAPGQVWPKPEPKCEVRYVHLLENGNTFSGSKPLNGFILGRRITARARVELVEGQFDD